MFTSNDSSLLSCNHRTRGLAVVKSPCGPDCRDVTDKGDISHVNVTGEPSRT